MIYTIRFHDSAGNLVSTFKIACKDDAAALEVFQKIKPEYAMDLWQAGRLVARTSAERQAG